MGSVEKVQKCFSALPQNCFLTVPQKMLLIYFQAFSQENFQKCFQQSKKFSTFKNIFYGQRRFPKANILCKNISNALMIADSNKLSNKWTFVTSNQKAKTFLCFDFMFFSVSKCMSCWTARQNCVKIRYSKLYKNRTYFQYSPWNFKQAISKPQKNANKFYVNLLPFCLIVFR